MNSNIRTMFTDKAAEHTKACLLMISSYPVKVTILKSITQEKKFWGSKERS